MDAILIFITAGDEEEGERLGDALLNAKLVACVNRVRELRSDYWWQGRRDRADEVLLLAKSRRDLWPRILETIRAVHSYEVFEAIAVPIVEGSPDYLAWIAETTAQE